MTGYETDASDLIEGLEVFLDELDDEANGAMSLASALVTAEAKTNAPRGATGILAESVQATPTEGALLAGTLRGGSVAGAPSALAVENGTRPHQILPRFRTVLRWPIGGGFRFGRSVQHPGTAPQPFMQPALETKADDVAELFAEAVTRSARVAGF